MSLRTTPPFRAEHVGSLLRPENLLAAREKHLEERAAEAEELRRIEDDAIRHAVKRQEEVGLRVVTDGEFRRTAWHMDFLCAIGGVVSAGTQCWRPFYNEGGSVRQRDRVAGWRASTKVEAADKTIFGEHFEFLKSRYERRPEARDPVTEHGALPRRTRP